MCEKRPNEPWLAYVCRYLAEQPRAVLAVIGLIAASVLYCDLRSFIAEQSRAQEESVRVLTEMSTRLQTIEHRIEKQTLTLSAPPAAGETHHHDGTGRGKGANRQKSEGGSAHVSRLKIIRKALKINR